MVGVNTLLEALQRASDTSQATFTTTTLSGGQTHDFLLSSDEDEIDTLTLKPSDAQLPTEADILIVRPIVLSGSTDTDFLIHEDSDREDIDEVIRITGLSTADNPQTFQPGGGTGVAFQNQDDSREIYLRIIENSSSDSQYQIRIRWFDIAD